MCTYRQKVTSLWLVESNLLCPCSSFSPLFFDYQLATNPSHPWTSLSSRWFTINLSFYSRGILLFSTTWFLLKAQQKPLIDESLRTRWSFSFFPNKANPTPGHEFNHWNPGIVSRTACYQLKRLGKWCKNSGLFHNCKPRLYREQKL